MPDPAEVAEWRWVRAPELAGELHRRPGAFTYWLRVAFGELQARSLA
ncbi:MAG TPA: hypothetical protein VK939_08255 [Longimicrobiales bacterium]|nr:hypothetical protein [Longimicrobiales bacterium]